ncbi:unnamed protein product, partial [Sphacelaria rigidula]
HGYRKVDIPPGATSLIWFAEVKVIHEQSHQAAWICLATAECEKEELRAWTGANTKWGRHLARTHGLQSTRGQKIKATKAEACDRLEAATESNFFKIGAHRYRHVMQVRVLLKRFLPFTYVEDKDVGHYHAAMMMDPGGRPELTP